MQTSSILTLADNEGLVIENRKDLYIVRRGENGTILAIDNTPKKALYSALLNPMGDPTEGSIVKEKYKALYGKDASCGDALAVAMNNFVRTEDGIDVERLEGVASDNGIDISEKGHLNNGQLSMLIRNKLRGMLRRGERSVLIGTRVFHSEEDACAQA